MSYHKDYRHILSSLLPAPIGNCTLVSRISEYINPNSVMYVKTRLQLLTIFPYVVANMTTSVISMVILVARFLITFTYTSICFLTIIHCFLMKNSNKPPSTQAIIIITRMKPAVKNQVYGYLNRLTKILQK